MLLLDVKNYYHSVKFSFNKFNDSINNLNIEKSFLLLNKLLYEIHYSYTKIINIHTDEKHNDGTTILPIGLLSSGILADWYLNDFDEKTIAQIKPLYYGRYVDDVLIVIESPNIDKQKDDLLDEFLTDYFIIKNEILTKKGNKVYKINNYRGLEIQKDKIKLYLLDANASKAGLKKFENTIRRNSSEFRFLPDEDEVNANFDEEAYSIIYSDSINKLRSVEGLVHDKYNIFSNK